MLWKKRVSLKREFKRELIEEIFDEESEDEENLEKKGFRKKGFNKERSMVWEHFEKHTDSKNVIWDDSVVNWSGPVH